MKRVLVANRGEIAHRIIDACHALGMDAVAVFAQPDAQARHVDEADMAIDLGDGPLSDTYLSIERLIAAAAASGADAVHPGYGFLAERPDFARAVIAAGLTWVGPPPTAMDAMGDKVAARRMAAGHGVPVLWGTSDRDEDLHEAAKRVGYPLLVKAAAGGGGRGMRVVDDEASLDEALAAAEREALGAFGDGQLLIERFLPMARHIEVQILADTRGHVIYLGDRECSIQRRRQKVWEEAPAPDLDEDLREALGNAAVTLARTVDYEGAGTVEFLLGDDGTWAFIEMNTRIQVEHTVTEQVTGVDLVEWQLRIASGEPLVADQDHVVIRGHAIEARVVAEDPMREWRPATGTLLAAHFARDWDLRVDSGVRSGTVVTPHYDSLLAKVIATGEDRAKALRALARGLRQAWLPGVATNLPLLRDLCAHPDVIAGRVHTRWLENDSGLPAPPPTHLELGAVLATAIGHHRRRERWGAVPAAFRLTGRAEQSDTWEAGGEQVVITWRPTPGGLSITTPSGTHTVSVDDGEATVAVAVDGVRRRVRCVGELADGGVFYLHWGDGEAMVRLVPRLPAAHAAADSPGACAAPTPGTVWRVHVTLGDQVAAGDALITLESMKMEQTLTASQAGEVTAVRVAEGDTVAAADVLVRVQPSSDGANGA